MKLLIITCLKEKIDSVRKLMKLANISIFSATDITGFKDSQAIDLSEAWFASGDEKFDSVLLFSFTANANAQSVMELIQNYNEGEQTGFPVRAFIVPVEQSI